MGEDLLGEGQVQRGVDLDGVLGRNLHVGVLAPALQHSVLDLNNNKLNPDVSLNTNSIEITL